MDILSASQSRFQAPADVRHPYLSAASLVLAAFAVRLLLDSVLNDSAPFLIFTISIVIAAGRYGVEPGLLAMAVSLVLGTVAFMDIGISNAPTVNDLANIGVFVAIGGAMLVFAGELKAARERERRLDAALQQQRTESAMGTMAAMLAHELNQPLAAATNYVGASRRLVSAVATGEKDRIVAGLDEAESEILRAGEIIRHARGMVSSAATERSLASLEAMVASVLRPLRASGTCRSVDVQVEIDPDADALVVNRIQIEQVLLNLIRNACEASSATSGSVLQVVGRREESGVCVEIRDSGPGISEERFETLFSPGPKPTEGGLGLGLPISKTIVEAHGGRIWALNNPDGGASFFFTLADPEEV